MNGFDFPPAAGRWFRRIGAALLLLALLWTVLTVTVDVADIGPMGTRVGFSGVNGQLARAFPYDETLYLVTQAIGLCALAVVAAFALLGLVQWIRRRSLRRVDRELWALGVLYAATAALYLFFEIVVVNYRPVLLPGETFPAASYPSSHTMLAIVVFGSAAFALPRLFRRRFCLVLQMILPLPMIAMILGRVHAGVHWFTDVVGGVLFGLGLLMLYLGLRDVGRPKPTE
ncbi:MAG: phosphatase PAP2 family protein [Clostridia bacterium]|nr:phosphatase PAP2 family protein [Clostridia bacterium]